MLSMKRFYRFDGESVLRCNMLNIPIFLLQNCADLTSITKLQKPKISVYNPLTNMKSHDIMDSVMRIVYFGCLRSEGVSCFIAA